MIHSLEVDSIILEFGNKRVLQDVYFKNKTGKTTGILGRNGSGKTCLMNIIYGVLQTNNKSVRLDGKTIFNGFDKPQVLRYLPQFSFIPKSLRIKRIFNDFIHFFDIPSLTRQIISPQGFCFLIPFANIRAPGRKLSFIIIKVTYAYFEWVFFLFLL